MKISAMIEELKRLKEEHGDLEVTCTHSLFEDGYSFEEGRVNESFPDTYETTADNICIATTKPEHFGEKHIRIWM